MTAYLGNEEKDHDHGQSERNADEPEAELPGQMLDHVTANERSSVEELVAREAEGDIRRQLTM